LSIYQINYCKTKLLALPRLAYTAVGKTSLLRHKSRQTYEYYRIAIELTKESSVVEHTTRISVKRKSGLQEKFDLTINSDLMTNFDSF